MTYTTNPTMKNADGTMMISGPILDVLRRAPAGIAPPSTLLTDTTLEASGRLTGPEDGPQDPGRIPQALGSPV
jgi:hypothetical protein